MINFRTFLSESLDVEKLQHLEHAEDHLIHGGHEGVGHVASTLSDVYDFLDGKKTKTRITTKFDGAPSLVFGVNPENGKFFVASKSAFNKTPKINYTAEDIERNHGHAPGLVAKLKLALEELPKVMPKDGGVFQGDVMYGKDDVDTKDGKINFTPNTITYGAKEDSAAGRRVAASNFGIVVHTKYSGKTLAEMKAGFDVDQSKFKKDPAVNMISPELTDPGKFPSINKKQYEKNIEDATKMMEDIHHDTLDKVKLQDVLIKTHINQHVRAGTSITVKSYLKFLKEKMDKDVASVKTEAAKQKKQEYYQERIDAIEKDKDEFEKVFQMHAAVQRAKDALVSGLANTPGEFNTTIGGQPTKPEGFVAIKNGRPTKLVDRAEFSRLNFAQGAFQKAAAAEEISGEPPENTPLNPAVLSFGRMNPPTSGHGVLVSKVQEIAKEQKAKHRVVLSRSQDPEKNPLAPEEKLKHAKRMFQGANIEVADQSEPTIIHQLKKLEKEGHDQVTVVVGSDRVEEFQKLLTAQNGKDFKFKKIQVVSAGQRDPDAEGDVGMSASKMRGHAIANKFDEFKKGLPSTLHPEHGKELFHAVRQAMDIKIDHNTPGTSLGRYAKRTDNVGERARKEQERRLRVKEMEKSAKKRSKPLTKLVAKAPVKEDTTTADIRGLGNVSGNPGGDLTSWAVLNASDADTRDQIMNQLKKDFHDSLHTTAAPPTKLADAKVKK